MLNISITRCLARFNYLMKEIVFKNQNKLNEFKGLSKNIQSEPKV